ncbi:hypothetical protein CO181_04610 [candidate division WWE3 bacterium CG_4_9_14_3_um_filter_43_9]|uniref:Short-chain dehydrogenase n=1 Tax=candidate division WWE3 bacterium CG_4_9_14_3_um_filter_43_9 TaxID=1975082 RepID=A0A2M7WVV2_UNCKA|nr:MAG: hypothetical protein AUJ38_02675 [bacterium CG1_02_42_9]PJA37166.1 MAG: hypothetical protein CO181_04610 [candidate division WWE3 bacterium CG_4_9_14_3_um_filter_43_9]
MLKEKRVVITGASEGLGESLALRLAKEGAKIALLARDHKKLQAVACKVGDLGGESLIVPVDIRSKQAVSSAFQKIKENFGSIDTLVNNAGVWLEGKTEDASEEKIRAVFETNVLGHIYCIQMVLPTMKKRKSGHIFNVISNAGFEPSADWGIYTASKYAMRGLTDSLRQELQGTGIKVTGFYPAGMNTKLFVNAGYNYKDNQPWMMDKNEVVEIITFILCAPKDIIFDRLSVRKFIS